MAQIRVEALDKSFGDFHAVKAASFTVEDGEFLCLLGPSGCGKTTTLRMIAGFEQPTSGEIYVRGRRLAEASEDELALYRRQDVGFIFQFYHLLPELNTLENVMAPAMITARTAAAPASVSRKFAIPLLEYLDRERVTRRTGEVRLVL